MRRKRPANISTGMLTDQMQVDFENARPPTALMLPLIKTGLRHVPLATQRKDYTEFQQK
jgi:hypothetical protein